MKKRLKFVLGSFIFLVVFLSCVQKESEQYKKAGIRTNHQDVNANNYAPAELKAYNLATQLVVEKLQEPRTAQFPPNQERIEHIRNLGGKKYRIDSWVDSQDTYGAMTRKRFELFFRIDSSGVVNEKIEIEEIGVIPKVDYNEERPD